MMSWAEEVKFSFPGRQYDSVAVVYDNQPTTTHLDSNNSRIPVRNQCRSEAMRSTAKRSVWENSQHGGGELSIPTAVTLFQ